MNHSDYLLQKDSTDTTLTVYLIITPLLMYHDLMWFLVFTTMMQNPCFQGLKPRQQKTFIA
jgi:hypothetical protein